MSFDVDIRPHKRVRYDVLNSYRNSHCPHTAESSRTTADSAQASLPDQSGLLFTYF